MSRAAASRHRRIVRVVIDHSVPKHKPKALNTALPECRGDIVGVFDAEDDVHPAFLRLVEARFEESRADVVQAGVQLMNVRTSWWSLRNCLEYYVWFRSRLHFHADQRFIPLGGNTVFTRTALLRRAGGWDPQCLAEDCEIGVRLSTGGARVAVAYDPAGRDAGGNPAVGTGTGQAAHTVESGIPPGVSQGRVAQTAQPQAALAGPLHAGDAVSPSRFRCVVATGGGIDVPAQGAGASRVGDVSAIGAHACHDRR
jgi:hypothetical protein